MKAMRRESARLYRRMLHVALAAAVLAFLPDADADAPAAQPAQPPPFSAMHAGRSLAPWTVVSIGFAKRPTHYDLVDDRGNVVLHAVADNAASALAYPMHAELRDAPVVSWRWKIAGAIPGADPHVASREDAPARVVLEFDGDTTRLPLLDRGIYGLAKRAAGRELPYATLMYIWSNDDRVGTLIANPHTRAHPDDRRVERNRRRRSVAVACAERARRFRAGVRRRAGNPHRRRRADRQRQHRRPRRSVVRRHPIRAGAPLNAAMIAG